MLEQHTRQRVARHQHSTLRLRRLTTSHIPLVLALDDELFPMAYRIDVAELHQYLSWAMLKGTNMSAGIFDGEKMVGYVIMVGHPSLFGHSQEVAFLFRMAVRLRYRHAAAPLLRNWIARQTLLGNYSLEGRMRLTTSYRTVQRSWKTFRQFGARITNVAEQDRIGSDRTIALRVELVTPRTLPIWPLYAAFGQIERTRRMVVALPRRVLRKLCARVPHQRVPPWLREFTLLEVPAGMK